MSPFFVGQGNKTNDIILNLAPENMAAFWDEWQLYKKGAHHPLKWAK